VKRTQGILQAIGVFVHPEVLVQLRYGTGADVEGFNTCRRQHKTICNGLDGKVRRSPQAVACKKRSAQGNPGGPFGPPYDIPSLRHTRGNPDTELSGSLEMWKVGKAGKYCDRECLPHTKRESYHA
jgi:hypothetical protein